MNIASALKAEISRVARKEVRTELQRHKKSSASYRTDIAALKRRLSELERVIAKLSKGMTKRSSEGEADTDTSGTVVRYSAKSVAAQRKRLGLSAKDFGALIGVSGAAVYLWEKAESRPRVSQMPAIAQIRRLTKSQAAAKLANLQAPGSKQLED